MRARHAGRFAVFLVGSTLSALGAVDAALVQAQFGSGMKYLANGTDPGIGAAWTTEAFDDSSWPAGTYGVGYERSLPGADALLRTRVPAGSWSVYTRARFSVGDVSSVVNVVMGADYDDGYVAWINGVEIARSPEMPAGAPAWNTNAASHESSNAAHPVYASLQDVTARARAALHDGVNVLAVGIWNDGARGSTDLVLVPYLVLNGTSAITRGPYLQMGTPTGMVLRWRTDFPSDSRVQYRCDPAGAVLLADDPALVTEHVMTLGGLEPSTKYFYSVGTSTTTLAGGDPETFFVTSPEPGAAVPSRIWVIGDSGTADDNARAVRDAYRNFAAGAPTDLWLMLGDNAYPEGTDPQYQAAVFDMYPDLLRRSVLWPTLGNHDGITADSATQSGPYYDNFTLPRRGEAGGLASGTEAYYSFDYGNIHLICLESNESDRSPGGAMLTWLEQDLLETRQDWIIAFWHHPPYSKGSHDSDVDPELIEMRESALPILERGGVDLVLAGHSHSYERSFLIDAHYGYSWTFSDALKKDGGDGRIDGSGAYRKASTGPAPHEGAVYVVAGSSGQASGGSLDHPAMFLSLSTLGSLVLDVNGQELDARFLDAAGGTRDAFTLVKGPVAAPLADFAALPRRGVAPLAVQFTDRSTGDPTFWAWDFENDGILDSRAQNPLHAYAAAGLYTVALTASGPGGRDVRVTPDLICATSADGLADADGDGAPDGRDLCPCDRDPGQEDADHDGLGDRCDGCPADPANDADGDGVCGDVDTCPTLFNPGQDPEPCRQIVERIEVGFQSAAGMGSGTVTWTTSHEIDLLGFRVIVVTGKGEILPQDGGVVPCSACTTGAGAAYRFVLEKHRGGRGIFVEALRRGGIVERYGPAERVLNGRR